MPQLPLITDPAMMQQRWKSILDPVLAGSPSKQVEMGKLQSTNGTTVASAYAAPTNTIFVKFVAASTGAYEVYTTNYSFYNSSAGQTISSKIVPTKGSPEIVVNGLSTIDTTAGYATAANNTQSMRGVYNLVAGVEYVFQLQAQTSSGTATVAFATVPALLIAKEL